MDRRLAVALALALVAACTAARPGRVVARGTLGYAVAWGEHALYTVELDDEFALYVRDPDTGAVRQRWRLGPAERDLPALAVDTTRAWVGGDDHQVRGIDLASGATQTTWPIGAAVTALATAPDYVAIGDATGAVCLRRVRDGALLQCVVVDGPVVAIDRDRDTVVVRTAAAARRFTLPALAAAAPPPPARVTLRGPTVLVDGAVVARFAGAARAAAVRPDGAIAAVGWVRRLTEPSVIVVPPRH